MHDSKEKARHNQHMKTPLDDRPRKKANPKSKRSLTNRRKTAIALSVASIAILASIGFEIVLSHKNPQLEETREIAYQPQLKIVNDYSNDAYNHQNPNGKIEEDLGVIEFLTRQNKSKTRKIAELTEELQEAQDRLKQLKTEILMRGGDREVKYKNRIAELEGQLESAEQQISHLQADISARSRLIESKRSEIQHITTLFNEKNSQLRQELSQREKKIERDMQEAETFIKKLQKKFSNDSEASAFTTLAEMLEKASEHIDYLEQQLSIANQRTDQQEEQIYDMSLSLELAQNKHIKNQKQINDLISELDQSQLNSRKLQRKLNSSIATGTPPNAQDFEHNLIDKDSKTRELEEKYLTANQQLKTLKERVVELEAANAELQKQESAPHPPFQSHRDQEFIINDLQNRLASAERYAWSLKKAQQSGSFTTGSPKNNIQLQQDRLIRDLESSLAAADEKNALLEDRLRELEAKASYSVSENVAYELQERVDAAELKAFELEMKLSRKDNSSSDELAGHLHNEVEKYKKVLASTQNKLDSLQEELTHIKKQYDQAKENAKIHENKAIHLEELLANNQGSESLSPDINGQRLDEAERQSAQLEKSLNASQIELDKLRAAYLDQQKTIKDLQAELQRSQSYPEGTASEKELYYRDRITMLEEALEVQKDSLLAAQQELLRIEDEKEEFDENYFEMEAYFNAKIQELLQKNKSLEEQLAAYDNDDQSAYSGNAYSALQTQLKEAQQRYEEESEKVQQLEEQLHALRTQTAELQSELRATSALDSPFSVGSSESSESINTQISQLTNRLANERKRAYNAEKRLQEMSDRYYDELHRKR